MNFGEALEAIKAGKKAQREGWNGKGQYVYYVPAGHYVLYRGGQGTCWYG